MTRTENVPSEKKENPLLRTILRIGAFGLGLWALSTLQPTLALMSEKAFLGIEGTILLKGVRHRLAVGVSTGNGRISLETRR